MFNYLSTVGLRVLNLALTPVVVGLVMMLLGQWRARRGDAVLRLDRFFCGYLFALTFAATRLMLV